MKGDANFPPVEEKKNAVGSIPPHIPPPHPFPSLCVPSCLCNSSSEWAQWILSCLHVETSPGLGALLALCVNTCAQKRRAVSEWFGYTGPVVTQSAGVQDLPPLLPLHSPSLNTHTPLSHRRLKVSQSMSCLWLPDYSINVWAYEFRTCRWVNRLTGARNRCLLWSFLRTNLFTYWIIHELITDSQKSNQVQYNRANPLIIPILNRNLQLLLL